MEQSSSTTPLNLPLSRLTTKKQSLESENKNSHNAVENVTLMKRPSLGEGLNPVEISSEEKENKKRGGPKLSFTAFRYSTKSDIALFVTGCVLTFLAGLVWPMMTLIFGDILNDLSDGKSVNKLIKIEVLLGVVIFVCCFSGLVCIDVTAELQIKRLQYNYLHSMLRQEIGWFDTSDPSTLGTKLYQNIVAIRNGLGTKLVQIIFFVAMFLGGYGIAFYRGWEMTLVFSSCLPILLGGFYFTARAIYHSESLEKHAYAKAGGIAEEVFSLIRTVAAFGAEEKSFNRYVEYLDKLLLKSVKRGVFSAAGLAVSSGAIFSFCGLGFWYGGCTNNCFTPGQAVTVFLAIVQSIWAVGQMGPFVTAFMKSIFAAEDLAKLVDRKSEIDPFEPTGKFRYPSRPDKTVFASLNLRIAAGESIALVGGSGCGKSTVIQLLQRFYDPDSGGVFLDGIDEREFNLQWLRDQMSWIAENIRDGNLNATMEDIVQAAKESNAFDFISQFPEGFNTLVGEGGSQLSGGQKQRIVIARAILRKPTILILDEATSALDNTSERIVQNTLDKLLLEHKRTTIVIAHRLTTVRNADRIFVLDNEYNTGSIVVEEGTHDELMERPDGYYRALVETQQFKSKLAVTQMHSVESSQSQDFPDNASHSTFPPVPALLKQSDSVSTRLHDANGSVQEPDLMMSNGAYSSIKPKNNLWASFWKERRKMRKLWLRVMGLLLPYWFKFLCGCIAAIGVGFVYPLYSVIYAKGIVSYFEDEPDPDAISKDSRLFGWLLFVHGIYAFIVTLIQKALMDWAGQRLVRELRAQTFHSLLYQEMEFYDHPDHSTGQLSQLISGDTLLIKGWSGDNLAMLIQNASTLVSSAAVAFFSNAKLAAISCVALVVVGVAVGLESIFIESPIDEKAPCAQLLNEAVNNIRMINAYNLQALLKLEYRRGIQNAFVAGFFFGLSHFLQVLVDAALHWFGAKYVINGEIEHLTDMILPIQVMVLAGFGVGQTTIVVAELKRAGTAAARVFNTIDRKSQIDSRSTEGKLLDDIKGTISVQDVRFRYPHRHDTQIYNNISFTIESGQTVALVGSSGCGKSTIIQLLERFYETGSNRCPNGSSTIKIESLQDENSGNVRIDGVDIRDINIRSLRASMGLVSQEPNLFDTTITENIRYGMPDATMEEVIEAAKKSNAHDFISTFPSGYDTTVGRFGGQLSGGQKQRIAIARVVLRNPKILLLDEATSALDAQSEKVVQTALDELLKESKRTTIVIAHRLSTIRNADKIIVFGNYDGNGSTIVEYGTHDELMKLPLGEYRKLVRAAH